MKTTIPLHIDSADLAHLKDYVPDLSEFEMPKIDVPKLENVGRAADDTIDRLLGRSRPSIWPWVATSVGLVLLVGAITAAWMWMRRWSTEPDLETPLADATTYGTTEYGTSTSELDVPAVSEVV